MLQRRFYRFVFTTIVLLLICLPVLHPLMPSGMIRTDDGTVHLMRAIALEHSLQHDGAPLPRYTSSVASGYGAPLFVYYPPTTYYLIVSLHGLGIGYIAAWKINMALWVLIAALGAYLLAREWTDNIGGYVSAIAYVYAPYMVFDLVKRGTLTELAALALLPLVAWGFTRLALHGRKSDFALAALLYGLFIPVHNIVTVHGTLFLMAYCAFLWLTSNSKIRTFTQLFSAAIVGILLAGWFWLPAITETDMVKINAITEALDFVDVTRTLRPIADVFALPQTADPSQLNQAQPIALGWLQIIVAAIGVFAVWQSPHRRLRWLMLTMLVVAIVTVFLQVDTSAWVWRNVPLLGYSQFAWRVLGIGSLALALMCAVTASLVLNRVEAKSLKIASICVFAVIAILSSVPYLYAPQIDLQADSVTDMQRYESDSKQIALSSYGEYLPTNATWDGNNPPPNDLRIAFDETPTPRRLESTEDIRILRQDWGGTSATLSLNAAKDTQLTFDWFYVPNWSITVDDEPVNFYPDENGLLTINIAAGTHDVTIRMVQTARQQIALLLSGIGLLVLGTILGFGWRFWSGATDTVSSNNGIAWQVGISLACVGIGMVLIKALLIDTTTNPLHHQRLTDGTWHDSQNALTVDFSDGIRLLAATTPEITENAATVRFSLFWALTNRSVERDYSSIVQLRDTQGHIIAETTQQYAGTIASSNWLEGYYLRENVEIALPSHIPPLTYTATVGLFNPDDGQRLDVLNTVGNPIGVDVELGAVTVPRNAQAPTSEPIGSSDHFALHAINDMPSQRQVGDSITLEWVWQLLTKTDQDTSAKFVWLNDDNQSIGETSSIPLVSGLPTSTWQVGDTWRGWQTVYVPANLDAGDYNVAIAVNDVTITIGHMTVTTPERSYTLPDDITRTDQTWNNGITLTGYNVDENTLTLYWTTDQLISDSLRLFVHLVDANGELLAVRDGVPVDWTRPTTGWDVGEVIATQHHFEDLANTDYSFRVGWYGLRDGVRVLINEMDFLII